MENRILIPIWHLLEQKMINGLFSKVFPLFFLLDHPGQCYDPLTNVIKGIGAKWPMKNGCGRVMCEKMGNALYFSYAT